MLISQCADLSTLVHLVRDNSGGELGGTNAKQYRRLRENPVPGTPPKPCIFNVIHASAALVTAARLIRAGTESATVISEQVPVLLGVAQRYVSVLLGVTHWYELYAELHTRLTTCSGGDKVRSLLGCTIRAPFTGVQYSRRM